MKLPLEKLIALFTGFAIVFSLYAHSVLSVESAAITPLIGACIAAGLGTMTLLWARWLVLPVPLSSLRALALAFLWSGWMFWALFGFWRLLTAPAVLADWGLFLLDVFVPLSLILNNARVDLLRWIGRFCVLFALSDMVANFGDRAGVWILASHGGRQSGFELIERVPGLSGNSHAAGLVALVAVAFLAWRVRHRPGWLGRLVGAVAIVSIGGSLYLIDARRYGGEAIAVVLLSFGCWRVLAPQFVAVATASAGIAFSLLNDDSENVQRTRLMIAGLQDAATHPIFGAGLAYRQGTEASGFNGLWTEHVTESGIVDLAIAFGWMSTLIFLAGVIIALSSRRHSLPWPAALLTVMVGELAYGDPLAGFLGATVFFGSIAFVIFDDDWSESSNKQRKARVHYAAITV